MDTALREAMDPVLKDLSDTGEVRITVGEPIIPRREEVNASLTDEFGSVTEVVVSPAQPILQRIVTAAEQVQEWAVEALWAKGLPATWPECPEHPGSHPLKAAVRGDSAVWECPRSGNSISTIGHLHS